MNRVAIVTCEGNDVDPDSTLLLDALAAEGLGGELVIWDDGGVDWETFDLTVVRSTWNYIDRRAEFLQWARSITRLENPYPVIEYSTDKHYLADLEARGLRVVPSRFCDVGDEPLFPEGDFVVKPCVGAGSLDADRYHDNEHDRARHHVAALHDKGRDALIQPYVESVDLVGERALIFVDGNFAHAMTKGAMLNTVALDRHSLFRRAQMTRAVAEDDAVAFATNVLRELGWADLLYGRVDLVGSSEGWMLMELELVEPSLFLSYEHATATKLAQAIKRRLI
jgi:glutathione synthase/RimK-type ligase-like ATP-grasp enzyme